MKKLFVTALILIGFGFLGTVISDPRQLDSPYYTPSYLEIFCAWCLVIGPPLLAYGLIRMMVLAAARKIQSIRIPGHWLRDE